MNKYYKKLMDHFNKTSDAETNFYFYIAQDHFGDTYFINKNIIFRRILI